MFLQDITHKSRILNACFNWTEFNDRLSINPGILKNFRIPLEHRKISECKHPAMILHSARSEKVLLTKCNRASFHFNQPHRISIWYKQLAKSDISKVFKVVHILSVSQAISVRSASNLSKKKIFSFQPHLVIQPCQLHPPAKFTLLKSMP